MSNSRAAKVPPNPQAGDAHLVWVGRGSGRFKNRIRVHFRCDDGRTGSASYSAWQKNERKRWVFEGGQ